MSPLDQLTRYFERFPGVGARQAKRFAFYLLTLPETDRTELTDAITALTGSVAPCVSCQRFFTRSQPEHDTCSICSDPNRDRTQLLIVAHDQDITAIERSEVYTGMYFVLGGMVPLLQEPDQRKLRGAQLKHVVTERQNAVGLQEIILGFPVNPDGENTGRYVEQLLSDLLTDTTVVAQLGRGLSTGSELEYADRETIKNAFHNRQ